MPCSSCGKSRTREPQQPVVVDENRARPVYTVTSPDGEQATFDDYQRAATHRRAVNGVLTTTS